MKCLPLAAALATAITCFASPSRPVETTAQVIVRGHAQSLRVYGQRGGMPAVVASGDGGWIHLAPHVAEALASRGYFVVGLDARHYLEAFTAGGNGVSMADVPRDFAAILSWASAGSAARPILVGASEGAALSVLAAADSAVAQQTAGVVSLGLPPIAELGWRWTDSLIYITHGVPNEPLFSVAAVIDRVSPVPFAAIYSTHDEFVADSEARRLIERAGEPKQLWMVPASDHRFSDNEDELDRRLLEAMSWVRRQTSP